MCGFDIIVNLIFVTFFGFLNLSHFWGLNTIKVHYHGYFVCTTPTILYWSTDQFEALQALLWWSVDVHVVLALSSI